MGFLDPVPLKLLEDCATPVGTALRIPGNKTKTGLDQLNRMEMCKGTTLEIAQLPLGDFSI